MEQSETTRLTQLLIELSPFFDEQILNFNNKINEFDRFIELLNMELDKTTTVDISNKHLYYTTPNK